MCERCHQALASTAHAGMKYTHACTAGRQDLHVIAVDVQHTQSEGIELQANAGLYLASTVPFCCFQSSRDIRQAAQIIGKLCLHNACKNV